MPDEAFGGAREALAAIEADRVRLRRRVRAASWWFYPVVCALIGLMVAQFTTEHGWWWTLGGLFGLNAAIWLQRRQTGVAARPAWSAPAIVLTVLVALVPLGHMLLASLAVRYGLEAWNPAIGFSAAAFVLLGLLVLERVMLRQERRAR